MAPAVGCAAKCTCCTCGDVMGTAPSHFPTSSEVRQEIRERSSSIFDNWNMLNKILGNFEEVIHKRWSKKTQEQRKAILLNAYPHIPFNHRPDLECWRKELPEQRRRNTEYRDTYMRPYINVEDLTQGRRLFSLLDARGRRLPHEFCLTDWNAAHLGLNSHALRTGALSSHTMLLYGKTTRKTYGQLLAWEYNFEAEGWLKSRVGFLPGHGLLVLEIQQKVLEFLVQCCQLILHDQNLNDLTPPTTALRPSSPKIGTDDNEWPSLLSELAEAPYGAPDKPRPARLEIMIAAKRSAAEDHYWLMKEDPGYFEEALNSCAAHNQDMLKLNGSIISDRSEDSLWDENLFLTVYDTHRDFFVWDIIYEQVIRLHAFRERYSATASHSRILPVDLRRQLQILRTFLNRELYGVRGVGKRSMRAMPLSPELKHLFRLVEVAHETPTTIPKAKKATKDDPLLWIHHILSEQERLWSCGYSDVIEMLEKVTQQDPKQKQRLSPWTANLFSEVGVIAEVRRQLSFYHPCVSTTVEKEHEDDQEDWKKWTDEMGLIDGRLLDIGHPNLDLGVPSDGKFHYPACEPRTRATTEAMRKAEQNLDNFWKDIDDRFYDSTGSCSAVDAMLHFLSDSTRQIRRTPEWFEPQNGRQLYKDGLDEPDRHQEDQKPRSESHIDDPISLPSTSRTPSLPKRILKTLNVLFPSSPSSSNSLAQSLQFSAFFSALTVGLGFDAYRLHLGCWIFIPLKEPAYSLSQIKGCVREWGLKYKQRAKDRLRERRAAIMFHEPWLGKEICAKDLRIIRRRLEWYGFTRDIAFSGYVASESEENAAEETGVASMTSDFDSDHGKAANVDLQSAHEAIQEMQEEDIDLLPEDERARLRQTKERLGHRSKNMITADTAHHKLLTSLSTDGRTAYAPDPRAWRAVPPKSKQQISEGPKNSDVSTPTMEAETETQFHDATLSTSLPDNDNGEPKYAPLLREVFFTRSQNGLEQANTTDNSTHATSPDEKAIADKKSAEFMDAISVLVGKMSSRVHGMAFKTGGESTQEETTGYKDTPGKDEPNFTTTSFIQSSPSVAGFETQQQTGITTPAILADNSIGNGRNENTLAKQEITDHKFSDPNSDPYPEMKEQEQEQEPADFLPTISSTQASPSLNLEPVIHDGITDVRPNVVEPITEPTYDTHSTTHPNCSLSEMEKRDEANKKQKISMALGDVLSNTGYEDEDEIETDDEDDDDGGVRISF